MVSLAIMDRRFQVSKNEIEVIKQKINNVLEKNEKILFAYIHGSFGNFPFKDIDISAYCDIQEDEVFDLELEMSYQLEIASGYTVDFKVLNYAPIGFQFSVVNEGILLFERDKTFRLNFIEGIGLKYMDYFEFSKLYLRERIECIEK